MSKILDQAVTEGPDGYTFRCPGVRDSICGDLATGTPFTSSGWPTKKSATARGAEHFREHKTGEPTSTLEDFRAEHGLAPSADGLTAVSLEDI